MTTRHPPSDDDFSRLTIAQVAALLDERAGGDPTLWAALERDHRAGVRRLAVRARRQRAQQRADRARSERLLETERSLWGQGATRVAGVDEVGRGCLAGPVVAAAVVLPPGTDIAGLDDSKSLTRSARESLSAVVAERAVTLSLAAVEAAEIDRINILQASMAAMRQALADLDPPPEQVLVDGNRGPGSGFPERALVGGDSRSLSIAAASVVAKVHRDALMVAYDAEYPGYGFAKHKGYGSQLHLEALERLGPCPLHRMTFRPLADVPATRLPLEAAPAATLGRRGEDLAVRHLEALGWRILERGYRGAGGEIDVVAVDGGCLVFVEVKASRAGGLVQPGQRLRPQQQTHLARVARHYLARHPPGGDCRFDLIALSADGAEVDIEHVRDAFQAPAR